MEHPRGIDRQTFQITEGWPYVASLLDDALTTRIGSRVLRRDYGSDVPAFIDAPGSSPSILAMLGDVAEAADAIRNVETGAAVVRFSHSGAVTAGRAGRYSLDLYFDYLPDGSKRMIALGDDTVRRLAAGNSGGGTA